MSIPWPPQRMQVTVCANESCHELAVVIVAGTTPLCGDHGLQWYMQDRKAATA